MPELSHIDAEGRARMVDVGSKDVTARIAVASGQIRMSPEIFEAIQANRGPKGNVLGTAELAGVMGAKRTAELIPLCHQLRLDHVEVTAELDPGLPGVTVQVTARAIERTGVEMEALTATAVALLTVYDMAKAAGHDMEIGQIRLLKKQGGKSGEWLSRRPLHK